MILIMDLQELRSMDRDNLKMENKIQILAEALMDIQRDGQMCDELEMYVSAIAQREE